MKIIRAVAINKKRSTRTWMFINTCDVGISPLGEVAVVIRKEAASSVRVVQI